MKEIKKQVASQELFEEAKKYLVGGIASVLHISPTDKFPTYIESGSGARVFDADGNSYIDYVGGFGPMILGYCNKNMDDAVIEQIHKGTIFAAPNKTLNEVSKTLTEIVPCAELVAYQSTGTEANMLAFRIARGYTGKTKVIRFEGHYHGWSDEQLVSNAPDSIKMMGPENKPWRCLGSAGQLESASQEIIVLPWNDIEILRTYVRRHGYEIAAVIMEPIMCNTEVVFPAKDYLAEVRDLTEKNDIVLIFDEVITGFRLALGGAQQYYGVTPDLAVFGKAIAGGFPLSAVAGKRKVMDSGVRARGTFNANPLSIAACRAAIAELEKPGTYERLSKLTKSIVDGIRAIAQKKGIHLYCDSEGSIWQLAFGIDSRLRNFRDTFRVDKGTYQEFKLRCYRYGVRFHPFRGRFYTSTAHTEADVAATLDVIEKVLLDMYGK
jgi:glutamate-1-semialdehyde 2,1-aminomutase